MSAQEFFRRGAALAIQSYTRDGNYKTDADVLFYGVREDPRYLLGAHTPGQLGLVKNDVGVPVEIEFSSHAHNRFRLVCDPLYQRNRLGYPPGCISILSDDATENNNCYDVWDLSRHSEATHADGTSFSIRIPTGKYLVEVEDMTYHGNTIDATLRLRLTRRVTAESNLSKKRDRNLRGRNSMASQEVYTFDVPLTSCGPSNLVLLDLDLVKKRLWKPQLARTSLDPALGLAHPDLALDPELELELGLAGLPAAKRPRLVASPLVLESYIPAWESVAPPSQTFDRASMTPFVAKQEINAASPTLSAIVGLPEDQEYTFELDEDSDSENDARSTGTAESEGHDGRIDFVTFPISTGIEKQAGDSPPRILPTPSV